MLLETKNMGISFGGLQAVSSVNLYINKNELVGLIGPNGAGKTTISVSYTHLTLPTTPYV